MPISPADLLKIMVIAISGSAMLIGMALVFANLHKNGHGFGPNSLKALGQVAFLPCLLIISVSVPEFKSEVLSALLGTVAGYVLSNNRKED
ncbi:hypothetical protein KIK84_01315 [Curvibacter sp. CHRR-16]|uniref:hypothetical protein n=1 Tax=Curvibacter sp. CHRR-16 TaxID=2835872 RepID=UPI001BD9AB7C|nr:hypothetical protein [Curvibacter sp. CHRR-16]MBT0568953.1 hypothetical protein [Curvibacter sp. CHRR-16]